MRIDGWSTICLRTSSADFNYEKLMALCLVIFIYYYPLADYHNVGEVFGREKHREERNCKLILESSAS